MIKKDKQYLAPLSEWSELDARELLCDSYNSGIDGFDYEDIDWGN